MLILFCNTTNPVSYRKKNVEKYREVDNKERNYKFLLRTGSLPHFKIWFTCKKKREKVLSEFSFLSYFCNVYDIIDPCCCLKLTIPWLQVDMVTPMLTQLTYEGLLDEVSRGSRPILMQCIIVTWHDSYDPEMMWLISLMIYSPRIVHIQIQLAWWKLLLH